MPTYQTQQNLNWLKFKISEHILLTRMLSLLACIMPKCMEKHMFINIEHPHPKWLDIHSIETENVYFKWNSFIQACSDSADFQTLNRQNRWVCVVEGSCRSMRKYIKITFIKEIIIKDIILCRTGISNVTRI